MQISYELWLRNPNGQHVALIDNETLLSLAMGESIYGEGSLEITTTNAYSFDLIKQDGQLEFWRMIYFEPVTTGYIPANLDVLLALDGTPLQALDGSDLWALDYTVGDPGVTAPGRTISHLIGNTVWLIVDYRQKITGSSAPFYYIKAEPFTALCKRRVVANYAGSAQADKTAKGDDMMKAIMREQFGTDATDATRDISAYLAIAADTGAGVSMTKAFARRNVFIVLQEIMQAQAEAGTRIYFGITYDIRTSMPTFRTWVNQPGEDRSRTSGSPVIFSADRLNLADPMLTYDYSNEVNFVYALGQKTGIDREEVPGSDPVRMAASVYNRREDAYDARSSTTASLADEAAGVVWAGRPKKLISGTLLSTPDTAFGIQWDLGYLVTAEFANVQQDCIVESISLSTQNGVETINGTARGLN